MISQYQLTSKAKNSGKGQRLANSVLTACFILFVIFCNFSISIAQAAAYIGVVVWLIQTYLQKTWNQLQFPLAWPLVSFVLASSIATLTAVDAELSLSGLKKISKIQNNIDAKSPSL